MDARASPRRPAASPASHRLGQVSDKARSRQVARKLARSSLVFLSLLIPVTSSYTHIIYNSFRNFFSISNIPELILARWRKTFIDFFSRKGEGIVAQSGSILTSRRNVCRYERFEWGRCTFRNASSDRRDGNNSRNTAHKLCCAAQYYSARASTRINPREGV